MKVRVLAFADFRELLGAQTWVTLSTGANVGVLLEELARQYPGFRETCFTPSERPKPLINMLVNGVNIEFLNSLETILTDGDIISLFIPVAGG